MKNICIITSIIVFVLVSFLGITYSYEYNEVNFVRFELVGDSVFDLSLGNEYVEYGVSAYIDGDDVSSLVNIDNSTLDVNSVGKYKIKYEITIGDTNEYIYRIVNVRENIKPAITLLGEDVMYIDLFDEYIEPGYNVSDNYDNDLKDKVIITSNLNVDKVGEYKIEYLVTDSSGNSTKVYRTVIVK